MSILEKRQNARPVKEEQILARQCGLFCNGSVQTQKNKEKLVPSSPFDSAIVCPGGVSHIASAVFIVLNRLVTRPSN